MPQVGGKLLSVSNWMRCWVPVTIKLWQNGAQLGFQSPLLLQAGSAHPEVCAAVQRDCQFPSQPQES